MVTIYPKGIEEFIHDIKFCKFRNDYCTIHNPSDHKMKEWPINIRETALAERLCPHGVGHPDPDSINWLATLQKDPENVPYFGIHGCDGCCYD